MTSVFQLVGKVVDRVCACAHHNEDAGVASKGARHGVRLGTSAAAIPKQMVGGGGVELRSKVDGRVKLGQLRPIRIRPTRIFDRPDWSRKQDQRQRARQA